MTLSVGLSCSGLELVLNGTMSTFFFILKPFSTLPLLLELLLLLIDKFLPLPLELRIVFKSFDSTLKELPVESLVMVTEPDEEEVDTAEVEVVDVVEVADDDDIPVLSPDDVLLLLDSPPG